MFSWLKRHWKTIASVGCTVVATGALPINPMATVLIGATCTAVLANKSSK